MANNNQIPELHEEHKLGNEQFNGENQAEPVVVNLAVRRIRDYQMPFIPRNPSCIRLTAAARNYELKQIHLSMLPQFNGMPSEDALAFMRDSYATVQTLLLYGLLEDELRLRCFSYCMKELARNWLLSLEVDSIDTWEKVMETFMMKWYPAHKTLELRKMIHWFSQKDGEKFHEAWERFNDLLNQCPHHGFDMHSLTQFFHYGLTDFHRCNPRNHRIY